MRNCFLVLVLATWISTLAIVPTQAADVSFNLLTADETHYSHFLNEMRLNLTNATLSYGGTHIPVMAYSTKFLLVDLEFEQGTFTIAMRRSDLYLEGYLDKIDGNYRAHFFLDASPEGKADLFPNARNRLIMFYKGSYSAIEGVVKQERTTIPLGFYQLRKLMNKVYGQKKVDVPTEARLMLFIIQMVPEAARSKYIENKITENFYTEYRPDPKAIRLEIRWARISKGIKNSRNGVINPVLDLEDIDGRPWIVDRVEEIAPDMALLKNEEPRSRLSTPFLFSAGNYGGDHAMF